MHKIVHHKCLKSVTVDQNQAEEFAKFICINHAPSFVHFCRKKCMQEGAWSLYMSFTITIIREVQVNLSKGL